MLFCSKCGSENPDGAKFCGKCASPIVAAAPAGEAAAPGEPEVLTERKPKAEESGEADKAEKKEKK